MFVGEKLNITEKIQCTADRFICLVLDIFILDIDVIFIVQFLKGIEYSTSRHISFTDQGRRSELAVAHFHCTGIIAEIPVLEVDMHHIFETFFQTFHRIFTGGSVAVIIDQFMMGDNLLVAPVVEKGATSRKVILPPGRWRSADGRTYIGATVIEVSASLAQLPYFEKYSMPY